MCAEAETMSSGPWRSSSKIHTVGAVADVSRSGPVPLPTLPALRTFRSSGVFAAAVGWDSSGRSNSQRENFGERMLMRRCSSADVLPPRACANGKVFLAFVVSPQPMSFCRCLWNTLLEAETHSENNAINNDAYATNKSAPFCNIVRVAVGSDNG